MELKTLIEEADSLKKEIETLRPISRDLENKIIQKFRLDWNYHSNNIEGNSLTYGETKSFLLHGLTAQGKPLKDHLDIKGHNEAILWLDDILKNNIPLTEKFIRELHQLILVEPYDSPAITPDGQQTTKRINIGEYKRQPNHVKTATGEIFYFSTPEETPAKMHELLAWYNDSLDLMHPIILAAEFHYKFIIIHPFDDGNGRISRILMNLILMKNGYPPIVIKTNKKDDYFRALRQADGGEETFFRKYIIEQEIDSLNLFLNGAKGNEIEDDDDIDKQIALFKASINVEDAKEERAIPIQSKLFENSIKPLLESAYNKVSKFNDLFRDVIFKSDIFNAVTLLETKSFKTIKYLENHINKSFNSNSSFTQLKLTFTWTDFDHVEYAPFSCHSEVTIELSRFKYVIKYEDIKLERRYHIDLNEKDIKRIVNKMASDILYRIQSETIEKED